VRVGILGGTFDPIHLGHLVAAEQVRCALDLDRVLFVPAGQPPHKPISVVSDVVHRVRMVQLAIASNPCFELSLVDVDRPGRSYTVEMLEILRQQLGSETGLYFIAGMDSLLDLTNWREPQRLIGLCRLAVVNRPPYPAVDLQSLERRLPGISRQVDMVRIPGIYISSSDLQERVAAGMSIRYLVPETVERYLRDAGLYLATARRG
jgi:nicotinate-nucleotide adenylyltransferase